MSFFNRKKPAEFIGEMPPQTEYDDEEYYGEEEGDYAEDEDEEDYDDEDDSPAPKGNIVKTALIGVGAVAVLCTGAYYAASFLAPDTVQALVNSLPFVSQGDQAQTNEQFTDVPGAGAKPAADGQVAPPPEDVTASTDVAVVPPPPPKPAPVAPKHAAPPAAAPKKAPPKPVAKPAPVAAKPAPVAPKPVAAKPAPVAVRPAAPVAAKPAPKRWAPRAARRYAAVPTYNRYSRYARYYRNGHYNRYARYNRYAQYAGYRARHGSYRGYGKYRLARNGAAYGNGYGRYVVQVGSFANSANAQALADQLRAQGIQAYVSGSGSQTGAGHLVRSVGVRNKTNARRLLAQYRAAGFPARIVPIGNGMMAVSAGVYSSPERAQAVIASLNQRGLYATTSYTQGVATAGGGLARVYVGRFGSRAAAAGKMRQLQSQGIPAAVKFH